MPNKFADAVKRRSEGAHAPQPDRRYSRKRDGTKHVGGYFSPEVSKQLRLIALDEGSSVQELLGEGIDMVFQSRQKPTIATR